MKTFFALVGWLVLGLFVFGVVVSFDEPTPAQIAAKQDAENRAFLRELPRSVRP